MPNELYCLINFAGTMGNSGEKYFRTDEYKNKYLSFKKRQRLAMNEKSLSKAEIEHNESWGRFMFAFMYYTGYNIFESMTDENN